MNNKIVQGFSLAFAYLALGALGYFLPVFNTVASLGILLSFVYFAKKDWVYSIYFLLIDLVVNPHGNLFELSWSPVSIREFLFVLTLGVLMRQALISKKEVAVKKYPWWALILLGSVALGFVYGVAVNGFSPAFDDANSYAYLLILILLPLMDFGSKRAEEMLKFFFGNLLFLATLTLFLSVFFSHAPGLVTDPWYGFFRDMRIAEITLLVASPQNMPGIFGDVMRLFLGSSNFFYRVFIPSQILLFLPVAYYALKILRSRLMTSDVSMLVVFVSGLLLSLSRSYLIAAALVALLICLYSPSRKLLLFNYKKLPALAAVMIAGAVVAILSASVLPQFKPDLEKAIFFETSAEQGRETAVTSRWTLLDELHGGIVESLPFGAGMGANLVYRSDDPRIVEISDGIYKTYRFEWGYHDLMYKTGLSGLMSLGLLLIWLLRVLRSGNMSVYKLSFLAFAGIMIATNIFSPYLNHPLGAICLMFLTILDDFEASNALD